ncbi:MAG: hypothetical protein ACI4TX_00130 [Christensenellales bacterium]
MKLAKIKNEKRSKYNEKLIELIAGCDCGEYRDEAIKLDILQFNYNDISLDNMCSIEKNSKSKGVVSDKLVKCVNKMLDKPLFNVMSNNDKFDIFENLIKETAKYIGISVPSIVFIKKTNLDVNLDKQQIKEIKKYSSKEEFMEIVVNSLNLMFGESSPRNDFVLNYFTNDYFKQLNKLNLKNTILEHTLGGNYLATIRHECQHLLQFANMREFLNGGIVENKYKIMTYLYLMETISAEYKLANGLEENIINIPYICNLMELDARFSEFEMCLTLLQDERIGERVKVYLNEYLLCFLQLQANPLVSFANMSEFVCQNIKMIKFNFEKEFGHLPQAQHILQEFNKLDMESYLQQIDECENQYRQKEKELIAINNGKSPFVYYNNGKEKEVLGIFDEYQML